MFEEEFFQKINSMPIWKDNSIDLAYIAEDTSIVFSKLNGGIQLKIAVRDVIIYGTGKIFKALDQFTI